VLLTPSRGPRPLSFTPPKGSVSHLRRVLSFRITAPADRNVRARRLFMDGSDAAASIAQHSKHQKPCGYVRSRRTPRTLRVHVKDPRADAWGIPPPRPGRPSGIDSVKSTARRRGGLGRDRGGLGRGRGEGERPGGPRLGRDRRGYRGAPGHKGYLVQGLQGNGAGERDATSIADQAGGGGSLRVAIS